MATTTACDILTQITTILKPEVPVTEEVTDKLIRFADIIADAGPEERTKALQCGAYSTVCNAWALCCSSGTENVLSPGPGAMQCRDAVLRALYSITAGNPEIIDAFGWQILTEAITYDKMPLKTNSEETHILTLRVIRNVSIQSEENREHFTWDLRLMDPLVSLIIKDTPTSAMIQEWCGTLKALVLADDPRVAYNRAPERKRVINQTKVLPTIAGLVSQPGYEKDAGALNAMVVFLGTMAVNEDVCLRIEHGNVFPGIVNIFINHFMNKTLLRNTISLLRYLCIESNVREKCSAYPLMKGVLDAISWYKNEEDVVDVGFSCTAMMTLRSACLVNQFIEKNGLSLTLQTMKDYKNDMTIIKGACFTLRNVYENGGPDAKEKVSAAGFLSILTELLTTLPELKEYYLMPILREFGDAVATEEESIAEPVPSETASTAPALASATTIEEIPGMSERESVVPGSHPEEDVTPGFGEAAIENILDEILT